MAILIQFKEGMAGIKLPLDGPLFHIGRSPENNLSIDDELVSNTHALIEMIEGEIDNTTAEYYLKDLRSTNGTFVNDKPVKLYKLNNEDLIRIGMNTFTFIDNEAIDPCETTKLEKSWIPGVYYTAPKNKKNHQA